MQAAILLLNFGEPGEPTPDEVVGYLERIFLANASLDDGRTAEEHRARSRELARRRAPGLLEDYRRIGGSPLGAQCEAQAEALREELRRRGLASTVHLGMQFTEPSIAEAVGEARETGAARVVALPVYPLCGRSTTVAALETLRHAIREAGWRVPVRELTGWHAHPGYLELRADAIRRCAAEHDVELDDPGTLLYFSAHGTPLKYLSEGPRYDLYVDDYCREVAGRLGLERFALGFQNHGNRGIAWTEPENEALIGRVEAERLVVDAASFMHEQSETLVELDVDLREAAEARGLEFHRAPLPHDDPRFAALLADLVEPLLAGEPPAEEAGRPGGLAPCRCRPTEGTFCLNASRFAAAGPGAA